MHERRRVQKFFDYQVNDTAKWTDKCGSERYLGDTCAAVLQPANDHCFKSQTAAYQTMRFYNQCVETRGSAEDEQGLRLFFATGTASDGRSKVGIQFNYDVVPSLKKSLCGNEWNGGSKSARSSAVLPSGSIVRQKRRLGRYARCSTYMADRGVPGLRQTKSMGRMGNSATSEV